MVRRFILNDVEEQRYNDFRKEHCGGIEVIFSPNEIGTNIYVRCRGCNTKVEISDLDSW